MPPKNLKRLAPAVIVPKAPVVPKVPAPPGRRGRGIPAPPTPVAPPGGGAPQPPPVVPVVDLTALQQQMGQFQAFMQATQAGARIKAIVPLGVALLPPPLGDQPNVSSGSKKKDKKSKKPKKGSSESPKKSKADPKKVIEVLSRSGSESSESESGVEGDLSESDGVSSSDESSSDSVSSRESHGKLRRRRHLSLFKSRAMKLLDANALAAAMLKWDAGVTLVGHGAMLLFQGVVSQLEKVTSSKRSKKRKLGTLERLELHTGSETTAVSLPEKFAGYVMEMVPVKLLRRLMRDSRVTLSLDHYWEKNKGNFVAPDAVCRAGPLDQKRRLASFSGTGFELIELHSTIAMVMSIVDPVHGLALQALTRVLAKVLSSGYSAAVAIRYASTIHAELALDSARKTTYGKCFNIDIPTLVNCSTEPSPSAQIPPPSPRVAAALPGADVARTPVKSRGACYAYNSRDGCVKGTDCGFQHHCGLCKVPGHGRGNCPSAPRDRRHYDKERR